MWESFKNISHGRISLRRLSLLASSLLMAVFFAIGVPAAPAAAADAVRTGDKVNYDSKTFTRTTSGQLPSGLPSGTDAYAYIDTINGKAYFLLTNGPADKATSAEYTIYDLTSTGAYGNHSPPQTVAIVNAPSTVEEATQTPANSSCNISETSNIGWILCPVVSTLAKAVDYVYKIVASFLEVRTVTTNTGSSIYRMWAIVRDIANICFVGAFLVIIYSQITSIGYSNYNLKKMLPRLIIGAILVNVSFWLCAIAVDASNLIGYSIHDLFMTVMKNLNTAGQYGGAGDINVPTWTVVAGSILSGAAVVAGTVIAVDTGVIFLLIPSLIAAALAILVVFIILAARQALIVCLIIISPLAFVAYLLPNTEKWFDKWMKGLLTLLFLFPIFSVIFSGAQLAGLAIIQTADGNIITMILGMTVQVAPLFITPLLLKFSGGILNRVGALTNNPNKGLVDRTRKWAQGEREHRKRQYMTASERHLGRNPRSWNHRSVGRSINRRTRMRAMQDKENDALLEGRAESRYNQRVFDADSRSMRNQQHKNTRAHEHHATGKIYKERMESADEEHWQNHLASTGAHGTHLRNLNRASHVARGRAGVTEESMKAANERALQNSINVDATIRARKVQGTVDAGVAKLTADSIDASGQHNLQMEIMTNAALSGMQRNMRVVQGATKVMEESMQSADDRVVQNHIKNTALLNNMKVQSVVDAGVAKMTAANVEAHGNRKLQQDIYDDRTLRKMQVDTHEQTKRSEVTKSILDNRAEAHWNKISRTDAGILARGLEAKQIEHIASDQKKRLEKLYEEVAVKGADSAGVLNLRDMTASVGQKEQLLRIARDIKTAKVNDTLTGMAKNEAEQEFSSAMTTIMEKNEHTINGVSARTYAAGIGSETGVFANIIAKSRKEFGDHANERKELASHFKLNAGQIERLAMGEGDVTVTDDEGNTYTFKADDVYTRDMASEEIFNVGSHNQKMRLLMETGAEYDAAGNIIEESKGVAYAHRRTIQQAAIKTGFKNAAPAINDKTYDDINNGKFRGEASWQYHSLREILEGRLNMNSLSTSNAASLKKLFADINDVNNPLARAEFDRLVNNEIPGTIQAAADDGETIDATIARARIIAKFDDKREKLRRMAADVLSNSTIRQNTPDESVEELKRFAGNLYRGS